MEEPRFSLEDKLNEIRAIIEKMQKGVSDFDRQIELFEQGAQAIQACRAYLDGAEMQVQQLIEGKLRPLS